MTLGPFLHPFAAPASTDFTTIVRGEGAAIFDRDGNRFVDALASLWYCNIGHGRAEVADVIARQARTLGAFHTFERFTNEPAEAITAELAAMAPMPDARVFLTSSGSESVDSALKLARMAHVRAGHPERTIIVGRRHGYHGVTYGGLSVQGLPLNQEGFGPLVGDVVQIEHDDVEDAARLFARDGDRIAAVVAEPVIGAGGVHPPVPGYLEGLRRLCDDHGAFLIFDEVICGFGRLGDWWGATHFGVRPDMVTFAKAVTSGYVPLGGVLVGPAVRAPLEADPSFVLRHGHTYSGHPTACAAAIEVQRITRDEDLVGRARVVGARLERGLRAMVADGLLAEARGEGAVWAAVPPDGLSAVDVRDAMIPRGVIARPLGPAAVAFCPPLVIGDDDLDRCLDALAAAVTEVRERSASKP